MTMPWSGIGRWTVWLVAFSAVYVVLRICELEAGDAWALWLYRTVVHVAIGVYLAALICRETP